MAVAGNIPSQMKESSSIANVVAVLLIYLPPSSPKPTLLVLRQKRFWWATEHCRFPIDLHLSSGNNLDRHLMERPLMLQLI